MNRTVTLFAATTIVLAPAAALATPGNSPGPNNPSSGNTLSPQHDTGQPGAECGEDGPAPGQSADAPGGGSAFADEDVSVSGSNYAGEQPQNSRNTASVSQYDTACLHQPT